MLLPLSEIPSNLIRTVVDAGPYKYRNFFTITSSLVLQSLHRRCGPPPFTQGRHIKNGRFVNRPYGMDCVIAEATIGRPKKVGRDNIEKGEGMICSIILYIIYEQFRKNLHNFARNLQLLHKKSSKSKNAKRKNIKC